MVKFFTFSHPAAFKRLHHKCSEHKKKQKKQKIDVFNFVKNNVVQ